MVLYLEYTQPKGEVYKKIHLKKQKEKKKKGRKIMKRTARRDNFYREMICMYIKLYIEKM